MSISDNAVGVRSIKVNVGKDVVDIRSIRVNIGNNCVGVRGIVMTVSHGWMRACLELGLEVES